MKKPSLPPEIRGSEEFVSDFRMFVYKIYLYIGRALKSPKTSPSEVQLLTVQRGEIIGTPTHSTK